MANIIKFYRIGDEYGCFSNFAAYPIKLEGKTWPTSEHYFQAQKFVDPKDAEAIRDVKSPMVAATMGRDRKKKIRRDWDSAKDEIMYCAIRAKFSQHADIRETLLATGDAKLIEHTANDNYWADGGDGNGKNMLGILLMRLRDELRVEAAK